MFSPLTKLTFVHLCISPIASNDWDLHQLDIKNVFLHGDCQEEVHIKQLSEFVAQGEIRKIFRIRKSLYGLKQSPRVWFGKFITQLRHLTCTRISLTTLSSTEIPIVRF